MNTETKKSVKNLRENDLYSIFLYAIYKCTGDPQYSTLSELIYTLDRSNLIKLCSIFGGCTIKIPTLDELKVYSGALLIYNLIKEGRTFQAAFEETGLERSQLPDTVKAYKVIEEIINGYKPD